MNNIQSISRVIYSSRMFDEPANLTVTTLLDCSEEEKVQSFFPSTPTKHPETPKLHKKRTKTSMGGSPDRGRKAREAEGSSTQNFGHWSLQQKKRYHWFLEMHSQHFLHKHMRRMDKIFKAMAVFVGSRQAEQCRSHHQKMEKKFSHAICLILLHLRRHHYQSALEEPLRQDILATGCTLERELLSEEFLMQHLQEQREEQPQQNTQEGAVERIEQFKEQAQMDRVQQLDESELLQLYPLDFSKNLVDSLLEVDAPHHNFQMI